MRRSEIDRGARLVPARRSDQNGRPMKFSRSCLDLLAGAWSARGDLIFGQARRLMVRRRPRSMHGSNGAQSTLEGEADRALDLT